MRCFQRGIMHFDSSVQVVSVPRNPLTKREDNFGEILGTKWKGQLVFLGTETELMEKMKLPYGYKLVGIEYYFRPHGKYNIRWTDEKTNFTEILSEFSTLDIISDTYDCRFGDMPKIEIDNKTGKLSVDVTQASWHYKCRHDFNMWYPLYLQSGEWYIVRQTIMSLSDSKCAMDGCYQKATQIHHKHYRNVGQEEISDLLAVCAKCHMRIHRKLKTLSDAQIIEVQSERDYYPTPEPKTKLLIPEQIPFKHEATVIGFLCNRKAKFA